MDQRKARELAAVMMDYANGKAIECRHPFDKPGQWHTPTEPNFSSELFWRVKNKRAESAEHERDQLRSELARLQSGESARIAADALVKSLKDQVATLTAENVKLLADLATAKISHRPTTQGESGGSSHVASPCASGQQPAHAEFGELWRLVDDYMSSTPCSESWSVSRRRLRAYWTAHKPK